MSLEDYVIDVANGNDVSPEEIYRDDPNALVEMWDYVTRIDEANGVIEIDQEDIYDEVVDGSMIDNKREKFRGHLGDILQKAYYGGRNKADIWVGKMRANPRVSDRELTNVMLEKKESKDTTMKVTEAGMALGGIGTLYGLKSGSVEATGVSGGILLVSATFGAKARGKEQKLIEEAADGLVEGYNLDTIDYRIEFS